MAQFEDPTYSPKEYNLQTMKRGAGKYTAFFPREDDVLTDDIKLSISNCINLLDSYRFTYIASDMDEGNAFQEFANLVPSVEAIKGWEAMEAKVTFTASPTYSIQKIKQEHIELGISTKALSVRTLNLPKFNASHRMAKLATAIDSIKLVGQDAEVVTDVVFIYTKDGIENMKEAKEVSGGRIDYTKYPKYWTLFTILKLQDVLGFKVINLGKGNADVRLADVLNNNFEPNKTPIPDIKQPYVDIPPYNKDKTMAQLVDYEVTQASNMGVPAITSSNYTPPSQPQAQSQTAEVPIVPGVEVVSNPSTPSIPPVGQQSQIAF